MLIFHFGDLNSAVGDKGRKALKEGSCPNRKESSPLDDKSKSLVLVNYFRTIPLKPISCEDNSGGLIEMLQTCHRAAGNRWANFVAVDYYKVQLNWPYFFLFFLPTFVVKLKHWTL